LWNQTLVFLCAAVALLTVYTMMELWKIQISKALHTEYAHMRKAPGQWSRLSDSPPNRPVNEPPVRPPVEKSPESDLLLPDPSSLPVAVYDATAAVVSAADAGATSTTSPSAASDAAIDLESTTSANLSTTTLEAV
ncbi:hypothetical protein PMAYCL1PPCAC_13756, partial [Pristionchus mayeri]